MRSELQPALRLAATVSLEDVAAFLGELEQIRITALARLSSPAAVSQPDELLDVGATAKRLGVSQDYLYRHQRKFPLFAGSGGSCSFLRLVLKSSWREDDSQAPAPVQGHNKHDEGLSAELMCHTALYGDS